MNAALLLLVCLLALDLAKSSLLSWLDARYMTHPVPSVVADVYDAGEYARQQAYEKAGSRVGRISRLFDFCVTLALLLTGGFGWYWGKCVGWFGDGYAAIACFVATLIVASRLLDVPFDYYSTFVIEERFGFNRSTRRRFAADAVKSAALSVLLSIGMVDLLSLIYGYVGCGLWLWGTVACAVVMAFFTLFYSNLIVPLFNKQTPLPEGELRSAIEAAASAANFKLSNIYVIDGSKRSTKANAYFTGFGAKKRIVLYDTLTEQLTTRQIVAVLMHEVGHYRHHDIQKSLVASIVQVAVYLYLFSLVLSNSAFSVALGYGGWSFVLSLEAFGLLVSPLGAVLSPVFSSYSRRCERAADAFAVRAGCGPHLVAGLKKLSAQSLSNLTPHPWVVWYEYSHPALAQRIEAINSGINKANK